MLCHFGRFEFTLTTCFQGDCHAVLCFITLFRTLKDAPVHCLLLQSSFVCSCTLLQQNVVAAPLSLGIQSAHGLGALSPLFCNCVNSCDSLSKFDAGNGSSSSTFLSSVGCSCHAHICQGMAYMAKVFTEQAGIGLIRQSSCLQGLQPICATCN